MMLIITPWCVCRPFDPPPAAAVVEELQEQLFTHEEELNSRKEAIVAWEDGLTSSECAPMRACMERDAECTKTEAVWHEYLTKSCTLTSCTKHSLNFNKMLEEH
jgi:hypothetical protein